MYYYIMENGMTTTITVRKAEIAELIAAAFPEYRGRTFKVVVAESVYVDRMWGGGSRQEIKACTTEDGAWVAHSPTVSAMQAPCGSLPLDPRAVYAVHSIFCGKDTGITFHVHPQSPYLPKMLGQD